MAETKEAGSQHPAPQPVAATVDELEAIFPENPGAALACYKKKMTVAQAHEERSKQLAEANKELKAKLDKIEADAAALKNVPGASNTAPLGNGGNPGAPGNAPAAGTQGDQHAFMKAVDAYAVTNKVNKGKAMLAVSAQNPELHQQYLASIPRGSPRPSSANIERASSVR